MACGAALRPGTRRLLFAQVAPETGAGKPLSPTHPDVASVDHERILAEAEPLLGKSAGTITAFFSPRNPGTANDYYSEPIDYYPDPKSPTGPWIPNGDQEAPQPKGVSSPEAFTAHRDAVYIFSTRVATLTAAFVLTGEARYAGKAAEMLRAWFLTPATRMSPSLQFAQHIPNTPRTATPNRFQGIVETVSFAEVAQAIPFLASSGALTTDEIAGLHEWFASYFTWLNTTRVGGLARDQRDHHGSSWLLQSAAYARLNATGLTSDDSNLDHLRHQFRTLTLRAQINATGGFPHELSTSTPYRNSLFNLDMLCAACDLLSTRFESAWDYELQDGPGMRTAIAFHVPFIENPRAWPYPADAAYFKELPGRRPGLLLAGRAYNRPEYTALWRSLAPLSAETPGELLRCVPIHQPLLWIAHPKPVRLE